MDEAINIVLLGICLIACVAYWKAIKAMRNEKKMRWHEDPKFLKPYGTSKQRRGATYR